MKSIKHTIQLFTHQGLTLLMMAMLVLFAGSPQAVTAEESMLEAVFGGSTPAIVPVATEGKQKFPVSGPRAPRYVMHVVATAYSSDPAQTDSTPCTPAMGRFNLCENYEKYGVEDTIANNCLPLGTQVQFPELYGDRVFTVRDRMNARYGCSRIDFWVGSVTPETVEIIQEAKAEARAFGLKRVKMNVYGRA